MAELFGYELRLVTLIDKQRRLHSQILDIQYVHMCLLHILGAALMVSCFCMLSSAAKIHLSKDLIKMELVQLQTLWHKQRPLSAFHN